jgi:hypothetical protein
VTTFTDFVPSTVAPFSFSPTLDGQTYNVTVTWLLFGKRFYINVYALDGSLVCSRPMVGSPTGIALENLMWNELTGLVTAVASAPHGYKIGTVVGLTVAGAAPTAYNGLVDALITGPDTFTYPLAANPGAATAFGTASYNVNLIGGMSNSSGNPFASTLVFRQQSQQLEVSP